MSYQESHCKARPVSLNEYESHNRRHGAAKMLLIQPAGDTIRKFDLR
jgi:hypothetical protein